MNRKSKWLGTADAHGRTVKTPAIYAYWSKAGQFLIVEKDGYFCPCFEGVTLGRYIHPECAAEDLADGQTLPLPGGIDSSLLGIPYRIDLWERIDDAAGGPPEVWFKYVC